MNTKAPLLGVNVDHIATIRQARGTTYPSPVEGAILASQAGADQITVHLREDRRHIQDKDVLELKEKLSIPLNLEMAATEEMVTFAREVLPKYCCIVPEKRQELTTEGGLDVVQHETHLQNIVSRLEKQGIIVSLFIEPTLEQIQASKRVGASEVEFHTGAYAEMNDPGAIDNWLCNFKNQIANALKLELTVNVGHGLNLANIAPIAREQGITTFNIGHALIADAVFVGLETAVKNMKKAIIQQPAN